MAKRIKLSGYYRYTKGDAVQNKNRGCYSSGGWIYVKAFKEQKEFIKIIERIDNDEVCDPQDTKCVQLTVLK